MYPADYSTLDDIDMPQKTKNTGDNPVPDFAERMATLVARYIGIGPNQPSMGVTAIDYDSIGQYGVFINSGTKSLAIYDRHAINAVEEINEMYDCMSTCSEAWAKLKWTTKECWLRYRINGESIRWIRKNLNMTDVAVSFAITRADKKLREFLTNTPDYEE